MNNNALKWSAIAAAATVAGVGVIGGTAYVLDAPNRETAKTMEAMGYSKAEIKDALKHQNDQPTHRVSAETQRAVVTQSSDAPPPVIVQGEPLTGDKDLCQNDIAVSARGNVMTIDMKDGAQSATLYGRSPFTMEQIDSLCHGDNTVFAAGTLHSAQVKLPQQSYHLNQGEIGTAKVSVNHGALRFTPGQ